MPQGYEDLRTYPHNSVDDSQTRILATAVEEQRKSPRLQVYRKVSKRQTWPS